MSRLGQAFLALSRFMAISRSIGKALADHTQKRLLGPHNVIVAQLSPVVHTEIELGQIPLQMALINVLVGTDKATLEQAEIALGGVGMHPAIVAVAGKLLAMVDRLMLAQRHNALEALGAVGVQDGTRREVLTDGQTDLAHAALINHAGAHRAAALNQGQETHILAALGAISGPGLAGRGDLGFVRFNDLAGTAHGTSAAGIHGFADAMRHKPSGFEGHAEDPVQLVAGNTFLAGGDQMDGLQPEMQLDMAALKNGAHLHGKRLAAGVALIQANAGRFAAHFAHALGALAVVANRAMRPQASLNIRIRSFFFMKMRGGKDGFCHV